MIMMVLATDKKELDVMLDPMQMHGYALGANVQVVPQSYVNHSNLQFYSITSFDRVIDRMDQYKIKNHAPVYARVTANNTLILETA